MSSLGNKKLGRVHKCVAASVVVCAAPIYMRAVARAHNGGKAEND